MTREEFHKQVLALVEQSTALEANASDHMAELDAFNETANEVVQPVTEAPIVEDETPMVNETSGVAQNIASQTSIDDILSGVNATAEETTPVEDEKPVEAASSIAGSLDLDALLQNAPSIQR